MVDARVAEFTPARDVEYIDVSALSPCELSGLLAPKRDHSFETGREFMARVRAWLADVPTTGTTIAFTHYAVVREILGALLGSQHAPTETAHTSLHHVRLAGSEFRVLAANDIGHLEA